MNMKRFQFWAALGLVLLFAAHAHAKAGYKGAAQMIETAEAIAIVEITGVESTLVKESFWTYRQKATAKVEKVLKGDLSGKVSLHGDEDFICARCHFETGRYLVFLKRDQALWAGNNWQLSVHKITGDSKDKVEWFKDKQSRVQTETPLSDVLKEIADVLAKPKPSKP
jgi:hypothetical protein